jgi:NADH dehydrogenase
MMSDTAGLLGLTSIGAGYLSHLIVAVAAGAGFGIIFRLQANSYAAQISNGMLYGLLWWIVGPLTLSPLLMGRVPTWGLLEAGHAFFNLIGHIAYGGITGFGFYVLVAVYLRRWAPTDSSEVPQPARKRIVILGGGFGGVSAAQHLEKLAAHHDHIETTLVSQSNYLLFTPMLAEVASSSLEAQHISAPVRASCPYTRFLRVAVDVIDTETQTIRVYAGDHMPAETIHYDHLILALGSVPTYYGLPGMAENSFTLKTLEDAVGLRNHVISLLERADVEPDPVERARQLTFVVAGAGFAGTEMIAELFDLAHSILRYYPRINPEELRFILIHSRKRILPELSAELADYSLAKLRARGIEFILNARVSGATESAVKLQDGRSIPTYTIVWTAGNQPNPILKTIPCERDRRGAVMTNGAMQVHGFDNVWAVGDCAQIPNVQHEGEFYPPTAQHALREGKVVAENVVAVLQGKSAQPFKYKTIGLLVALGHRTGAAEIFGYQFSGLSAWLLWRGVYLSKLPGLEKKARVLFDWTLDLLFPRDIVLTVDTAVTPQSQTEVQS